MASLVPVIGKTNDDIILEVLQGNKVDRWPRAKIVKIFISSNRSGKWRQKNVYNLNI